MVKGPTAIMAIMIPATAGRKYRSVADGACVGCVVVVEVSSTANAAVA